MATSNYSKTDQKLHWLSQTIAKVNRSYVAKKEDDSHTNLYYDDLDNRLAGRWINNGREDLILTLNLSTLHFDWLDSKKQQVCSVPVTGRVISDVESELADMLTTLGFAANGFTEPLHFQIPDYPFAGEPVESIEQTDINQWRSYRKLANELCALVLGYLEKEDEIRIWPHHFDTGIYVEVRQKVGLGFGLAMEDSMAGAPYFYMSGFPLQGTIEYNNLPHMVSARWETGEHWQGAILTLDKLTNGNFDENRQVITDYLLNAINWFIRNE